MDGGAPSSRAADRSVGAAPTESGPGEVARGGASRTDSDRDSRERLVRAAVELALEHYETGAGLRDVFAYLTPSSVAERAGLSRGLIYHHWGAEGGDGSQAFSRFLTAVSDSIYAESAVPDDLGDLADLLPDNLSDVILALSLHELDRSAGEHRTLFRASQALTIHGAWPEGEAEVVVARLAELYERLAGRLGREPCPPLTYADIAFTLMSIFEGFGMFLNVYPERVLRDYTWAPKVGPSDPDARWTLIAIAIEGAIANMTRPVATAVEGTRVDGAT